MPFCARNCCARAKAGSRKRAWTIPSACNTRGFGWSIRSMGTREFVKGIPEFCASIGFVENGRPVAGGIYNPATDETFLGSIDSGVTYNGKPSQPSQRKTLEGALVLASRSEVKRGEWKPFENTGLNIRPMGSVAYKLALVSVGLADVTFTLTPKNEWDVVAGAALVESAGAFVSTLENTPLRCNNRNPLLSGLLASAPTCESNFWLR